MAWFIEVLQRQDKGQPLGLFRLVAESDEGGGFVEGCQHDHPTANEAMGCQEARERCYGAAGFRADAKPMLTVVPTVANLDARIPAARQWAAGKSIGIYTKAHIEGVCDLATKLTAQLAIARQFIEAQGEAGAATIAEIEAVR